MKNLRATCIALTILSIATFSFASLNDASANEEADVRQAATQFYKALNTMFTGDVGPMLEAWSHRNDITYMGPAGGLLVGWGDVEKSWRDQAAMKLGGTVLPKKTHVIVNGNIAIVSDIEVGVNTNADGKAAEVSIRATNIFRKEDGKWKVIAHHTDLLPFLAN
jgi:ketosteroid isomerase-like protein